MRPSGCDCAEAVALLQDYLRRELTPEHATRVRQHLADCRHCFEHHEFEQRFTALLQNRLGRECCPETLRARLTSWLEGGGAGPDRTPAPGA